MNRLIVLFLALSSLLVNGTPISHSTTTEPNKLEIKEQSSRQGKTLGILTVAGSALSNGVGTAGSILGTTAKVLGGVKSLLLLGIGSNFLYNRLKGSNENLPSVNLVPNSAFTEPQYYETRSGLGSGYTETIYPAVRAVQVGPSWIEPVSGADSITVDSPITSKRYVHQ